MLYSLKDFGHHHWALLHHINLMSKDNEMVILNNKEMRCNPERHPEKANHRVWNHTWGTQLCDYRDSDGNLDVNRRLDFHDDWDCLMDLCQEGMIQFVKISENKVKMTQLGITVAENILKHKFMGGKFFNFHLSVYR